MKSGTKEYNAWWRSNHRESLRQWQADYRASSKGVAQSAAYNATRPGAGACLVVFILSALRELTDESRQQQAESSRLWASAERIEQKGIEKAKRAFIQKIFQPGTCVDCGTGFETLYPVAVVRCEGCARQRRLKNHGGGPRRRCKYYGVPYEIINPGAIFYRDAYRCQLCGGDLDMNAKQHHPKAPEIDHIIPLSRPGSPGHVLSNVQSAHRECNIRKGADKRYLTP
jgi:hypothetical protein